MAVGRVASVRLAAPLITPKGRVSSVRVVGSPITGPKGRVGQVRLVGTPKSGGKGRIASVRLVGATALVLNVITDQTGVEPFDTVEVRGVLKQGTADSYVFRQISGPTVALTGTGAARHFEAPAQLAGATLLFGVQAKLGSQTSPEVTARVVVRPQIEWVQYTAAWLPLRETVQINQSGGFFADNFSTTF